MTGYGQASQLLDSLDLSVEVKTLNGRFLDIKLRIPNQLAALESEIRKRVGSHLRRGRVDVSFNLTPKQGTQLELNQVLVEDYRKAADSLHGIGIEGDLKVATLLQLPGVLKPQGFELTETLSDRLIETLEQALSEASRSRAVEGRALLQELSRRLSQLAGIVEQIDRQSQQLVEHHRQRLERKIAKLPQPVQVDGNRLAQEVVFYAERSDISEELARLKAHLQRFGEVMEQTGKRMGKKLDFICQELNREMNTVTSKSGLATISRLAVDGKMEIEKLREQVQNVE